MSKIYLSAEAEECVRDTLSSQGHQIINIVPSPLVDRRIASHADLFFCDLGQLLFHGEPSRLGRLYPKDIPYNACSTGKYFIHNLKYTDPLLHSEAKKLGQIFIHVAQGYARCSCLPVDADSVITADLGIASACRRAGLHVLTIRTGHILLPGFSSGFIGGAAGRIGTQIFFHGDLLSHPDSRAITDFIRERGLEWVSFPEFPLTDIGSLLEEKNFPCNPEPSLT